MSCVSLSEIGGDFLQSVNDLPGAASFNFGQVYQSVNLLQSLGRTQRLQFGNVSDIFTQMTTALNRLGTLGFTTPMMNHALDILTGLPAVGGFTNGLFGFLQTTDLTAINSVNGATFLSGMRDLLGTGYAANIQGLNYLAGAFEFLSASLSNSDGVDLLTTLEIPPSHNGGLRNFGFLTALMNAYGDSVGFEAVLANISRLIKELKAQAFIFHFGFPNSDPDIVAFSTLVTQMNIAGLLLDETVTGEEGIISMTNMLEIISNFVK